MSLRNGVRWVRLLVEALEGRITPSGLENFDAVPVGMPPAGWSGWAALDGKFEVSAARSLSTPNGLAALGTGSRSAARQWLNATAPADVQASAAIYLDSLVPARVLARGSNLDTSTPTYYALSLTRGLQLQLLRVVNGNTTVLASLNSTTWLSGKWVRATLNVKGTTVRVQVSRADTGEFLDAAGRWTTSSTWAATVTDSAIAGPGLVGLDRPAQYAGTIYFDDFQALTADGEPLPDPSWSAGDDFEGQTPGSAPPAWSSSGVNGGAFEITANRALGGDQGVIARGPASNSAARQWLNVRAPADVQVAAGIYLDSLVPARVLARGSNLGTTTPTYYAVSLTRGLQLQLLRVVNGTTTVLNSVNSLSYFSGNWVRATLSANGTNLRVQVYRPDTAQYLDSSGRWVSTLSWAINLTDTSIASGALIGVERPALYKGDIYFDEFSALTASGDSIAPRVTVTAPAAGATLTGTVPVTATATDNLGVSKVEFYTDGALRHTDVAAPYRWDFDTTTATNGTHLLEVLAYDATGNIGRASLSVTTQNETALPLPTFPRHYSHIRVAQLAYAGTPLGTFEDQLLRDSIDLVIPTTAYLDRIAAVAPTTPQLIYTNLTNLYRELLLDWLTYADARGLSRESAFYHAARALPFTGNSASSQPVNWFWDVRRPSGSNWLDLTALARGTQTGGAAFAPTAGQALYFAYPERFREINFALQTAPSGGWTGVIEYASAVDASGNPTQWKTLPLLSDGTAGWTRSGRILFDPPADWKTASVAGKPRAYYLRVRTLTSGTAPVARTLLGRDYVNAAGRTSGTIPAFDAAADANGDGYLSDAEYASRAAGKDARFSYESRVFYPAYGQMRFATNPASAAFRAWGADHHVRLLQQFPKASGLFLDNSGALTPVSADNVIEPVGAFAGDYAALVNGVARAIAPDWVLMNSSGGTGTSADVVIARGQAYFEEFALRPLASSYTQFEEMAAVVARRAALRTPSPYAVLDTLPTGGSMTDPRTQMAALAYYYLLQDPESTFLTLWGGHDPAGPWSRHWFDAIAYNVGRPAGAWSQFATGSDPANGALTYKVYQRRYDNALVLYKPLSHGSGASGGLTSATATTHALGGTYRVLQADGTLGSVVTSITLRNGEGAVLVKVA